MLQKVAFQIDLMTWFDLQAQAPTTYNLFTVWSRSLCRFPEVDGVEVNGMVCIEESMGSSRKFTSSLGYNYLMIFSQGVRKPGAKRQFTLFHTILLLSFKELIS